MLFRAKCSFSVGVSVTKARAVAGICSYIVEEGYFENEFPVEVEITEFDERLYGNNKVNIHHIDDEWIMSESTITVNPDSVKRFAHLHQAMEDEMAIAEGEEDWRIDYGDDDISYVTKSEKGTVVSIDEHWDQAKESCEQANEWEDGETYWIDEVEGDVVDKLTFKPIE